MMQITVNIKGLDGLKEKMKNVEKQVKFAAMTAINTVAYQASQATKDEMRKVFDRPTPWVIGGVRYKKATRDKLQALVDLDFWGNKQGVAVEQVLKAEIFGGSRNRKRHEIALERAGILPSGMRIVPGAAAKRDAYGNMQAGQINQIISWFRGFGEQGYKANMSDKRRASMARGRKEQQGYAYFVLKRARGKLLPGIYQRFQFSAGSAVKPVMIFVYRAEYRRLLDFYGVAQRIVDRNVQPEFDKALASALRTAR